MERILLAGATGYLGSYILQELLHRNFPVRAIARNPKKLQKISSQYQSLEVVKAEITKQETLKGCCENIDVVISTIGITRQKDGLTYMEVDYQGNANLLSEALGAGVRKFIYVSVFKGDQLRHLKIMQAKERFVEELKNSGLEFTIIRPTGFFSDMGDFLNMAKGGKVYLFGDGHFKLNPIHGADLAQLCVDTIELEDPEINAGGPEDLSQNKISEMALAAWSMKPRIIHLPDWIRKSTIFLARTFTPVKSYGPIEFFLTAMAQDACAPKYGTHRLEEFFTDSVARETGVDKNK